MMNKSLAVLIAAMLILSSVTGCGKDEAASNTNSDVTVNLALTGDISTLDSSLSRDMTNGSIIANLQAGLFTSDDQGRLINELCKSYDISEDALTYTFYLRDDALWSNGESVTAHDFEYAWKRFADPTTGATYSSFISTANIVNGSEILEQGADPETLGVKAKDDYTLEVKLHTPMPSFIQFITEAGFLPLNKKFVEEKKELYGTTADNTLYSGAYKVDSWEAEYQVVLAKNPDYFAPETVKNSKIVYHIIKDSNTAINLFETNQLDVIDVRGEFVELFKDSDKLEVFGGLSMSFYEFNTESPVFSNVNARKAVACIIDKNFIVDEVYNNGSQIANYIIARGTGFDESGRDYRDYAKEYEAGDIEKGKEYWQTAKKELGIETCEIRTFVSESDRSRKLGQFLQSLLEENLDGMKVKFEQVTAKNSIQKEIDGEFDITFSTWGNYSKDVSFMICLFSEGYFGNTARFKNKEYNDLYKLIMNDYVLDTEKRWEAIQRAEQILIEEEAVIIPVQQAATTYLIQDNIKGFYNGNLIPQTNLKYITK